MVIRGITDGLLLGHVYCGGLIVVDSINRTTTSLLSNLIFRYMYMSIVACPYNSDDLLIDITSIILQFHLVVLMKLVDRLNLHKAVGVAIKAFAIYVQTGTF